MKIIAEISLYPLSGDYDGLIYDFVQRIKDDPGIEVTPGQVSTLIRGAYEDVFRALERECLVSLDGGTKAAVVIKLLNTV